MATKKKKRAADIKAKKRKKGIRFFLLSLFTVLGIAFLAVLFFTLSDFVGSPDSKSPSAQKRAKQTVVLYFSDANELVLAPEKRVVPKPVSRDSQAEEIVKALIEGPKTELIRTFPEETRLLHVKIDKDTALVDFDSSLIEEHPGGSTSEIATIYSLTNTLISNIPEIKKVKILINGKIRDTLKGHMDTTRAFTLNKDLIRGSTGE